MKKVFILTLMYVALSGCASILSTSNYAVSIGSEPSGANYEIINKSGQKIDSGKTPASVTLNASSGFFKGESYSIEFNKEGYTEQTFVLKSTIDGWYIGNILFGGLLGLIIIDPATGAMYQLPKQVNVSLDNSVSKVNSNILSIATIDSLTEEERLQLISIQ